MKRTIRIVRTLMKIAQMKREISRKKWLGVRMQVITGVQASSGHCTGYLTIRKNRVSRLLVCRVTRYRRCEKREEAVRLLRVGEGFAWVQIDPIVGDGVLHLSGKMKKGE